MIIQAQALSQQRAQSRWRAGTLIWPQTRQFRAAPPARAAARGSQLGPRRPGALRERPFPLTCFLAAVELRVLGARDVPARQGGVTEALHRHGPAQPGPPRSPPRPPLTFCPSGAAACPWRRLGPPGPRCASGPPAPSAGCAGERPRRGNSGGGRRVPGPREPAGKAGHVQPREAW